ncbi:MAG: hypothetical protein LBO03_05760 [Acidaminococcales bacterium]|jgi:hypothetical protein|nr:hypothetical protein [Acidaminococcales bacterium]
MVKTATMYTYDLDDAERALAEVKNQLKNQVELMKNTVGILICDPEFVKSGVAKTICAGLPFPIAGMTSVAQSVSGEVGRLLLTLMVLTSDDVFFAVGTSATASNKGDVFANAELPYAQAAGRLGAKPEMIMLFSPFSLGTPGNIYVDAFSVLCPDVPVFGAFAMDDLPKFTDCLTISNGSASEDAIAFILIGGNVAPRFFITNVSEEKMACAHSKITKCRGNVLMEVNGALAVDHFTKFGLAKGGALAAGLRFLLLAMDREKRKGPDDPPILNEVCYFDQSGFAICQEDLSANSTFEVAIFPNEYILGTSQNLIEKLNAAQPIQAIIMFSCAARRLSLRNEPLAELYLVAETVSRGTPYMIACTGGEICPVPDGAGALVNRFHNYALIACIL